MRIESGVGIGVGKHVSSARKGNVLQLLSPPTLGQPPGRSGSDVQVLPTRSHDALTPLGSDRSRLALNLVAFALKETMLIVRKHSVEIERISIDMLGPRLLYVPTCFLDCF